MQHTRQRQRSVIAGLVYSVAASASTIAILRGRALWSRIEDGGWGADMRLQTLDLTRGLEISADIDEALRWIEEDREGKMSLITCDATAHAQQVALRLAEYYRRRGDRRVNLTYTRLSAKPVAPDQREHMIDDPRAPRLIGLNELSLAFNDVVSAATMTEVAHGALIDRSGPAPGRTVISYRDMMDEEPPGMSRAYLDETLAVASTLRVPTRGAQDTGEMDLGRALGSIELSAVALMLAVISGRDCAPRSTSPADDPWGWGGSMRRASWNA